MDAIDNILGRNSHKNLGLPYPSKEEMDLVYKAALRAPDHAWLRASRFIEVTGKGLDKLSDLFLEFATKDIEDVTPIQLEKYKSAPYRAPMVIVLITKISDHPKVPEIEQMLSTAAAAQIKKSNSRLIFSSGESRERKTLNGKTTSPSYPNVIKGGYGIVTGVGH